MKKEKLRLNKETIRNLSDEHLGEVAGGKRKDGGSGGSAVIGCSVLGGCGTALVGCSVLANQCN